MLVKNKPNNFTDEKQKAPFIVFLKQKKKYIITEPFFILFFINISQFLCIFLYILVL